jgi:TctA family transporter
MNYYLLSIEGSITGIIFWVICTIIFSLTINKKNKYFDKPVGLNLVFFATGFLLYIIFELHNLM